MEAQLASGRVTAVAIASPGDEIDMRKVFGLEGNTLTLEERIPALEERFTQLEMAG